MKYLQKAMRFIGDEEGASAVEYALLVGLIAIAIVGAVSTLGSSIGNLFNNASTQLNNAGS